MDAYELAYAQGLAYAWGRNDSEQAYWGAAGARTVNSVEFAREWAELVKKGTSRPDLSGAFYAFREGRPLVEGRKPQVAKGKLDPLAVYCRYCESYPTHSCVSKSGFETNPHKIRIEDAGKLAKS